MKRFVMCLIIILMILFIAIKYYNAATATTECWWGVLYPPLSYGGMNNNDNIEVVKSSVSALDPHYFSIASSNEVHYKFFIVEWLSKIFSF